MSHWPSDFPDRDLLRQDVRTMVAAIAHGLVEVLGAAGVRGVYFKGSAQKRWDSLVDYVPGLSDVDIHVELSDTVPRPLSFDTAARLSATIEVAFRERAQRSGAPPLHVPRPQVSIVNDLRADADFMPTPPAIVETIYGAPYVGSSFVGSARKRQQDRDGLIENAQEVAGVSGRLLDRTGEYLWDLLRALSWRISPTGSRLLSALGEDPEWAWTQNRTTLIRRLRERGLDTVADNFHGWFEAGWTYYLSGGRDGEGARQAIRCGCDCLMAAADLAEQAER